MFDMNTLYILHALSGAYKQNFQYSAYHFQVIFTKFNGLHLVVVTPRSSAPSLQLLRVHSYTRHSARPRSPRLSLAIPLHQ